MVPERLVRLRARTVLMAVTTIVAVVGVLELLWITRHVLVWVLVSLFLALAMNPLVELIQRRFVNRRGAAVGIAYLLVLLVLVGIGFTFIPTLVGQVRDLVDATPGYVHDLTKGKGRLGFLQTKYHIVDKVRKAVKDGGATKVLGFSGTAIAVTKGVITAVVATITIAFMTLFMLLEGPNWVERGFGLMRPESQPRWRRVGHDIYRTVGGYVTGNLLISLIAGSSAAIVLLIMGVPYAIALGLVVALLDLIPLAGATLALLIVGAVAFLHSIIAGIVVVVFFVVYQQIENHFLQPVIYGRTVQLSPLVVLISVLVGAELGGVLGALGAIPVAGAIQVVIFDWLRERRERLIEPSPAPLPDPAEG